MGLILKSKRLPDNKKLVIFAQSVLEKSKMLKIKKKREQIHVHTVTPAILIKVRALK